MGAALVVVGVVLVIILLITAVSMLERRPAGRFVAKRNPRCRLSTALNVSATHVTRHRMTKPGARSQTLRPHRRLGGPNGPSSVPEGAASCMGTRSWGIRSVSVRTRTRGE